MPFWNRAVCKVQSAILVALAIVSTVGATIGLTVGTTKELLTILEESKVELHLMI